MQMCELNTERMNLSRHVCDICHLNELVEVKMKVQYWPQAAGDELCQYSVERRETHVIHDRDRSGNREITEVSVRVKTELKIWKQRANWMIESSCGHIQFWWIILTFSLHSWICLSDLHHATTQYLLKPNILINKIIFFKITHSVIVREIKRL